MALLGLGTQREYRRGRSQAESARRLGRKCRRVVGTGACGFVFHVCRQGATDVLLANKTLHRAICFVGVHGDWRLSTLGVVEFVGYDVANFPHVLDGALMRVREG